MSFANGSVPMRIVGGNVDFYEEYTTTNLYVERVFGGLIETITVSNDSTTDTISLSFDGATLAGDLKPGESLTLNVRAESGKHVTGIYVKGNAGGDDVRIWGW